MQYYNNNYQNNNNYSRVPHIFSSIFFIMITFVLTKVISELIFIIIGWFKTISYSDKVIASTKVIIDNSNILIWWLIFILVFVLYFKFLKNRKAIFVLLLFSVNLIMSYQHKDDLVMITKDNTIIEQFALGTTKSYKIEDIKSISIIREVNENVSHNSPSIINNKFEKDNYTVKVYYKIEINNGRTYNFYTNLTDLIRYDKNIKTKNKYIENNLLNDNRSIADLKNAFGEDNFEYIKSNFQGR